MAKFLFYDDKIINILLKEEKPSGGAAVQAYGWIKGLAEVGQDIDVLTQVKENEVLKENCRDLKLIPLYDSTKGVRWLRWLYYRFPYIYKKIKQAKPDYVYQGIPCWQSFLVGVICYWLGIKFVIRISNDYLLDDRFYKKHSKAHRYFQWQGMKLSYCILCQNDYQYNIIRHSFPGKKTIKISNPVFLKFQETATDVRDRKYIAWLGLYQYQKNLPLLYEIACLLKNEQFYIAGKEESKCDEETFRYLDKLKALSNVRFVDFLNREQVLPFLSKAKFLLNTSHYEGFSNTFLEAMSVGTPLISSYKVNPDNIITNYKLGIVYKDSFDLQKQFISLTPDLLKALSKNTLDYVIKYHDYKVQAEKLMSFLNVNYSC